MSNSGISDPDGLVEENATVLVGAGLDEEEIETFASFGFRQEDVAGPMSVLETDPASGSATTRSITTVSVTFDREIDPFTILSGDFFLDRSADADGSGRTIDVDAAFIDESDPSNRRVSFTLNTSLPAGLYQIKLSGLSELAGLDGTRATTGEDQVLGSFRVESSQFNPKGALDLGIVSDAKIGHSGRLDLASNPAASHLYKFSVPRGRDWSLSLDVSAQRDGLPLDAIATLYDAQGKEIVTVDSGKSDAPLDPSLTRRIAGGDYYIAVAGRMTGGETNGSYRLQLAAAPIVAGTSVVGIREVRANPNTLELTGLTVDFSGPIDPDSLEIDPSHVLSLVDAQGRSWPISLSGMSADRTRLTFVLGAALPAGSYQVRMGTGSTLADLSGQAPIGVGPVAGVLGTIDVVARATPPATELGTLWASVGSKVGGVVSLADGKAQGRSFTLLSQGSVALVVDGDAKSARFTILDASGRPIQNVPQAMSDGSGAGPSRWNYVLQAGTYTLIVEGNEPADVTLSFSLIVNMTSSASLLDTGTGQGPTADAKVIAPTPPSEVVVAPPPPDREGEASPRSIDFKNKGNHPVAEPFLGKSTDNGPYSGTLDATFQIASPAGSVPMASTQSSAPLGAPGEGSGATILVGGVPIGQPESTFDLINVVGPAPSTGSFALASNHPSLPHALLQEVAEGLVVDSKVVGESAGTIWGRPHSARRNAASMGPRGRSEGDASESLTDRPTLDLIIDLSWFSRAGDWIEDYLDDESPSQVLPEAPNAALAAETAVEEVETTHRIDSASLTPPALVIGAVLAAYRTRAELRKRANRPGDRGEKIEVVTRRNSRPKCRWGLSR